MNDVVDSDFDVDADLDAASPVERSGASAAPGPVAWAPAAETALGEGESYFEEKGHLELAVALLLDCVQQIASDPERKRKATRAEIAWLRGENETGVGVKASDVFESLGIAGWAGKFGDLALNNPKELVKSLKGLESIITEMSGSPSSAATYRTMLGDGGDALEGRIEDYRDRARAC